MFVKSDIQEHIKMVAKQTNMQTHQFLFYYMYILLELYSFSCNYIFRGLTWHLYGPLVEQSGLKSIAVSVGECVTEPVWEYPPSSSLIVES